MLEKAFKAASFHLQIHPMSALYSPIRAASRATLILENAFQNESNNEASINEDNLDLIQTENFYINFISNYTVYVITLCNIEGILNKTANLIVKELQLRNISLPENRHDLFYKRRENEIIRYQWYRDNLFAHTAYAKNQRTRTIQDTLLYYYAGEFISFRPPRIILGGVTIFNNEDKKMQEELHHSRGERNIKLRKILSPPEITLINDHVLIRRHFYWWDEYFHRLIYLLIRAGTNTMSSLL